MKGPKNGIVKASFYASPSPEAIRCTHFISQKATPHTEAQIFAARAA